MDFDLVEWLKIQCPNYPLDIPPVEIGQKQADDPREWLVTNGLGSFASGNIWGANTRRYHGLFVAALEPPVRRTLLFSRLDEVIAGHNLSTNLWGDGVVSPEGFRQLAAFTIYPVPTWAYALPQGCLIKQIAMVPNRQEVAIGYTWIGSEPARLDLHMLVNFRDFHSQTIGSPDWQFIQEERGDRLILKAYESAQPVVVSFSTGVYQRDPRWYWSYCYPRERERGLPDHEDNFHAGFLTATLKPGSSVTLRLALDMSVEAGSINETVRLVAARQGQLLVNAGKPKCRDVQRLVVAADSFVAERQSTQCKTIIAGYHWFADWGRDSAISLPGLTLSTGRFEIAKSIIGNLSEYLSQGMLPNNFPDSGMTPQYNTSDATFWWAWALWRYFGVSGDRDFVALQLPLLKSVVDWHRKGTRYGLKLDETDGLISGGEPGVQLTWMDAKVGDYVVTPRLGKAVEINALWFNFLIILEKLDATINGDTSEFGLFASLTREGFRKFWNQDAGCLFDVIHQDGTADASIRPNQLLAASLPFDLVPDDRARSILAVVERDLLTPVGLRSLSPADPSYSGRYGGGKEIAGPWDRDITYHQGTAWPWLLGSWVDARMKLFGQSEDNLQFVRAHLMPIREHILGQAGLGSVSEIFDGDPPHHPHGCIAQAWSVAELLRLLTEYPQLQ